MFPSTAQYKLRGGGGMNQSHSRGGMVVFPPLLPCYGPNPDQDRCTGNTQILCVAYCIVSNKKPSCVLDPGERSECKASSSKPRCFAVRLRKVLAFAELQRHSVDGQRGYCDLSTQPKHVGTLKGNCHGFRSCAVSCNQGSQD